MTTVDGIGTFRLVTEQGAERMTSADVLTLTEVAAHLEIEENLHRMTGWATERHGEMLRCERGETVRWIWPREE